MEGLLKRRARTRRRIGSLLWGRRRWLRLLLPQVAELPGAVAAGAADPSDPATLLDLEGEATRHPLDAGLERDELGFGAALGGTLLPVRLKGLELELLELAAGLGGLGFFVLEELLLYLEGLLEMLPHTGNIRVSQGQG